MKKNLILEKSLEFAVKVTPLYQQMLQSREYVISKQLIKAATSIGANIQEATGAQSRKDFISKMTIASKEARETRYWLIYLERSKLIDFKLTDLLSEIEEINRIISRIIITTKENDKEKSTEH